MTPAARAWALASAVPCVLGLAGGCDALAFGAYRSETPVVAFVAPADFAAQLYGSEVAVAGDDARAWVVASAGLGTAVAAELAWDGTQVAPGAPAQYLCSPEQGCAGTTHTGAGIAGGASWQGATSCGFSAAYGVVHQVAVACFDAAPARTFTIAPPMGFEQSGFGHTIAAPRRRRAGDPGPGEVVFIATLAGDGRVFAVQPAAMADVTPAGIPTGAGFGDALAVGWARPANGPTDLLLAVGAPGAGTVYVLQGDPRAGRPMRPIGCAQGNGAPGFGAAVALGDVDGDGTDDLITGTLGDATGRRGAVQVFVTAAAPRVATCDPAAWPAAATFACQDAPDRGVSCAGATDQFGASVTAGDLDADGRDEVVVGAPQATVAGVSGAGAAWVLHASGGSGTTPLALAAATVLRASIPAESGLFAARLVAAQLGTRDELFVAVPGTDQVELYLCTGIPGDAPDSPGLDVRCR